MEHEPHDEEADLADYVRSLPEKDSDGVMIWNDAQKEIIIANLSFEGIARDVRKIRELLAKGDPQSRRFAGVLIEELRTRIKDTPGF